MIAVGATYGAPLLTLMERMRRAHHVLAYGGEPTTKLRDAFIRGLAAFLQSNMPAADPEVIKLLTDAGAEVNARGPNGMTALHFAGMGTTDAEAVRVLLSARADVSARDDVFGLTPLESAAVVNGSLEIHRVLLVAEHEHPPASGRSGSLVAAALNPNSDVIRLLIGAENDTGVQTDLWPPLLLAAALNPVASVSYALLHAGADPNQGPLDVTPLMIAARLNPNAEVARVLLVAGADVNASAAGCTALH